MSHGEFRIVESLSNDGLNENGVTAYCNQRNEARDQNGGCA